jgi:hypothetical protein
LSSYTLSAETFYSTKEVKEYRSKKLELSGAYKGISAGYSLTEEKMTRSFLAESRLFLTTILKNAIVNIFLFLSGEFQT